MHTIKFETNYINKLQNDAFVHICFAPTLPVPENKLLEPVNLLLRDDPAFCVKVIVIDLIRIPLYQLHNIHTIPSHGLYSHEFIEWWLVKYPSSTLETPLAVYFYRRCKDILSVLPPQ